MDSLATEPLVTLAESSEPSSDPPATMLDQLVRDPSACLERLERSNSTRELRSLLALLFTGAGIFGAVVGAFRGGRQVIYCAFKIPLVLLVTLIVCTPAFVAIARAGRSRLDARAVVSATLAASARFGLVLAGLAPVLWLVQGVGRYHHVVLAIVGACVLAGIAAGALLFRALARGGAHVVIGLAFVAVYGLVGVHTAWLLRPFVVRPRSEQVPFVRPIEGDMFDSVRTSARSAAGIYDVARSRREQRCRGTSCN